MLVAGCGTTSPKKDSSDYNGPDATLRSPVVNLSPERRREIAEDLGGKPFGMPSEAMQEKFRAEFEIWKRKYLDAMHAGQDACKRETGETGNPGLWSGYSDAFVACMNARGWVRPRGSNPL